VLTCQLLASFNGDLVLHHSQEMQRLSEVRLPIAVPIELKTNYWVEVIRGKDADNCCSKKIIELEKMTKRRARFMDWWCKRHVFVRWNFVRH